MISSEHQSTSMYSRDVVVPFQLWYSYYALPYTVEPRFINTPWKAAIYDIADTSFGPDYISCLCTIKSPEMHNIHSIVLSTVFVKLCTTFSEFKDHAYYIALPNSNFTPNRQIYRLPIFLDIWYYRHTSGFHCSGKSIIWCKLSQSTKITQKQF